jgi:hypothetical protein
MMVSFLYLASSSYLDFIAGAIGFLAGTILVASGLLSLGIQSRSPTTSRAATHAAGSLVVFLPPAVAILGWPVLYFGAFFAVLFMPLVLICCLGWAWLQSRGVAEHLSALLGWPTGFLLRVIVFSVQAALILASWPLFGYSLRLLESMGHKVGWSLTHRTNANPPSSGFRDSAKE